MTVESATQPVEPVAAGRPAAPEPLATSTGLLLTRAAQQALSTVEGALAPLGIRARQYGVLALLAQVGPLAQIELVERLGIDRTTMVGLIDSLEGPGLVERRVDPSDRRAYRVQLTDAGRDALGGAAAAIAAAEAELFSPLGAKDWRRLHGLLRRLCGLEEHVPTDDASPSGTPAAGEVDAVAETPRGGKRKGGKRGKKRDRYSSST
jgi:DNA-binding MarR family transcriptional regulator